MRWNYFLLLLGVFVSTDVVQGQQCGQSGCFCIRDRISCIGAGLTSFPQLPLDIQQVATELALRSNSIRTISATDLQNYTNLESLDLESNQLTSIEPGSFSTNPLLDTLILTDNSLTEISDNLFNSTLITELDLADNDIQTISSGTFNGVQELATIDLSNNVIRTIPEDTFTNLIGTLTLTGNPLRCDCLLRWIPAFLSGVPTLRVLAADLGTCNAPDGLNGMALSDLTEEDFVCECRPSCVNGTCNMVIGECECDDGFIGTDCSTACPINTYGAGCQQNCTCLSEQESSPCENVDGTCNCRPGYTGESCELECPEGTYGQDCMDVCQCQNGASCHFITGFCNCTAGYMGVFCDMRCGTLRYGLGCQETCVCETGNCHHITGECSCPVGFFGTNCNHNCTEVPDCRAGSGREECSLATPEQTCGPCLPGYVGEDGDGNSECILCSGAPDCLAQNREPCGEVVNTCGPCFERHLGDEGFSNTACFDPCIDGVMNFDETDIDCGGSLCPSCQIGAACSGVSDCGDRAVCLGTFVHPSGLDFPFNILNINTCVDEEAPGNSILDRFKGALRGRPNPLPNTSPLANIDTLESDIELEIQEQFGIPDALQSIAITELDQAPGDPLYQTNIQISEVSAEESFEQMIENIHSGKLKGTLLLNKEDRKALFNF